MSKTREITPINKRHFKLLAMCFEEDQSKSLSEIISECGVAANMNKRLKDLNIVTKEGGDYKWIPNVFPSEAMVNFIRGKNDSSETQVTSNGTTAVKDEVQSEQKVTLGEDHAVALLKGLGYKLQKPQTQFVDV